ncbi:MAG: hypothetical protein AB7O37_13025 [Vicinamibacteria bacterium]
MKAAALGSLMAGARAELAQAVSERLGSSDTPHYRALTSDELRSRVAQLVEAFVGGFTDPEALGLHVRQLADERQHEGFRLEELQVALSALEECAWRVAERAVTDVAVLVPRLAAVSGSLGRAKDELARAFLDRSLAAERHAKALELRLADLFKGTEEAPID